MFQNDVAMSHHDLGCRFVGHQPRPPARNAPARRARSRARREDAAPAHVSRPSPKGRPYPGPYPPRSDPAPPEIHVVTFSQGFEDEAGPHPPRRKV